MEMRMLLCAALGLLIGASGMARAFPRADGVYPAGKGELYERPVRLVLATLPGERVSRERVGELLEKAHEFRYALGDPYRAALPDETARRGAGDCKAKSLWLIEQMGDRRVRYVIGKIHRSSELRHAWVEWHDGERWWILDPTNSATPVDVETVGAEDYIPLYRYGPDEEWSAGSEQAFALTANRQHPHGAAAESSPSSVVSELPRMSSF